MYSTLRSHAFAQIETSNSCTLVRRWVPPGEGLLADEQRHECDGQRLRQIAKYAARTRCRKMSDPSIHATAAGSRTAIGSGTTRSESFQSAGEFVDTLHVMKSGRLPRPAALSLRYYPCSTAETEETRP